MLEQIKLCPNTAKRQIDNKLAGEVQRRNRSENKTINIADQGEEADERQGNRFLGTPCPVSAGRHHI